MEPVLKLPFQFPRFDPLLLLPLLFPRLVPIFPLPLPLPQPLQPANVTDGIMIANSIAAVITRRHFFGAQIRVRREISVRPLPGSPISESMRAWIALICSA